MSDGKSENLPLSGRKKGNPLLWEEKSLSEACVAAFFFFFGFPARHREARVCWCRAEPATMKRVPAWGSAGTGPLFD
jgi:hypothetical protein